MRQSGEWRQECGQDTEGLALTLAERGRQALNEVLPNECTQLAGGKNRRYDAALLFLLFPLNVISDEDMARIAITRIP